MRLKPLGAGNSDIISLIKDGKSKTKIFKGTQGNTILFGDTSLKEKKYEYKVSHVATDDYSQEQLFNEVMPTHISNLMAGYNICYLAYGQTGSGASAGDVLGGMIIGGLIGKGASGDDKGAAAGAVIGGMIAADKNQNKHGTGLGLSIS